MYGTFPAAPSISLFALRFGLPADDAAQLSTVTVVGTALSAPIMLVSAEMALVNLATESAGSFDATLQVRQHTSAFAF